MKLSEPRTARRRLLACLLAVLLLMVDVTMVGVALPSIAEDLGAGPGAQTLVVTSYVLAFACTLLTGAWLGGLLGRRTMFVAGMIGFVAASLVCGCATSPEVLVAARVAQGIAGGVVSAQTVAVIASSFPKARHSTVFAIYGATAGGAAILGPTLGGMLVSLDVFGWTWRTVFLVNVPLGILAAIVAALSLSNARSSTTATFDFVGVALSTLGLVLLLYPLARSQQDGWTAVTTAMPGTALILLVAFAFHESRRARAGHEPMLRLDLFRERTFGIGCLLSLSMFGSFTGFFFTVSQTLQFGLDLSPLRMGLTTLPFAVGAAMFSVLSPRLFRILGTRTLSLGFALFAVSLLGLVGATYDESAIENPWVLALPLLVGGAGIGMFVAPLQTTIVASTDARTLGSASGIVPTVQQVGQAVGSTLVGLLYFRHLPSSPPNLGSTVDTAQSYLSAQRTVFYVLIAVVGCSALVALLLPRRVGHPQPDPVTV